MNPLVLVPVYNHPDTITELCQKIEATGYSFLVVDDGSNEPTRSEIRDVEEHCENMSVIHRDSNGGKGRAVLDGLRFADEHGYTHVVLLDADLQHDPADIDRFIDTARANPDALILGDPIFDESIPSARKYGRVLSQVWVWIETLSTAIRDPLCGYRCYPVKHTLRLMEEQHVGDHMEFEPEIAVRFYWDGGDVVNLATKVQYFPDMISHFDMWRDNLRISAMHCRLFIGMFFRIPTLLSRKES